MIFLKKGLRPLWLLAVFPVLALAYALRVLNGVPLADEWRWIHDLLLPWVNGELPFWRYITGEYAFLGHTHFFTLWALYVDWRWFGLDLRVLALWGLVFYVAAYLALMVYTLKLARPHSRGRWLALAGMSAAYFCMTSDFPWLLVVFEYGYYCGALLLLLLYDAYLRGRVSLRPLAVAMVLAALFLESAGAVAVAACLVMQVLVFGLRRHPLRATGVMLTLYMGTWALLQLWLDQGRGTTGQPRSEAWVKLLSQPWDIVQSLLISLAQPLTDMAVLRHHAPEGFRTLQLAVGLFGGALVLWSLWVFRRHKTTNSRLPVLLVVFAGVSWALVLLTRYGDFGIAVMDAQRFTRLFVLYYVGAALALYLSSPQRLPTALLSGVLLLTFAYAATFQFKYVDSVQSYFQKQATIKNTHTLWTCTQSPPCKPTP